MEVTRPTPATTPEQLAKIAKTAIACGADALCVRLDSEDTPEGLKDLFAVVQVCWGSGVEAAGSWRQQHAADLPVRINAGRLGNLLAASRASDAAKCAASYLLLAGSSQPTPLL